MATIPFGSTVEFIRYKQRLSGRVVSFDGGKYQVEVSEGTNQIVNVAPTNIQSRKRRSAVAQFDTDSRVSFTRDSLLYYGQVVAIGADTADVAVFKCFDEEGCALTDEIITVPIEHLRSGDRKATFCFDTVTGISSPLNGDRCDFTAIETTGVAPYMGQYEEKESALKDTVNNVFIAGHAQYITAGGLLVVLDGPDMKTSRALMDVPTIDADQIHAGQWNPIDFETMKRTVAGSGWHGGRPHIYLVKDIVEVIPKLPRKPWSMLYLDLTGATATEANYTTMKAFLANRATKAVLAITLAGRAKVGGSVEERVAVIEARVKEMAPSTSIQPYHFFGYRRPNGMNMVYLDFLIGDKLPCGEEEALRFDDPRHWPCIHGAEYRPDYIQGVRRRADGEVEVLVKWFIIPQLSWSLLKTIYNPRENDYFIDDSQHAAFEEYLGIELAKSPNERAGKFCILEDEEIGRLGYSKYGCKTTYKVKH